MKGITIGTFGFDDQGNITEETIEVSSEELGSNCWSPSRFMGGECDAYHKCRYPEKARCRACPSALADATRDGIDKSDLLVGQGDEIVTCHECGLDVVKSSCYELELYDRPWDDEPKIAYVCIEAPSEIWGMDNPGYDSCMDILTSHSWGDFRYFECDACERMICEQNPSNGWMSQYRIDDNGDMICLRCYEADILTHGIPRSKFEDGSIPGMFFSGDDSEPLGAGYECVEHDTFIRGSSDAEALCGRAIALIDSGHDVVVGYESLAIGGSEGYVSLFARKDGA